MISSKNSLLISLLLIILAIGGIMIGGSIAFTGACMLFIASGAMYHKSSVDADVEEFQRQIQEGLVEFDEEAGEMSEMVVDLNEISESDKEVVQRLFGFEFETEEVPEDDSSKI